MRKHNRNAFADSAEERYSKLLKEGIILLTDELNKDLYENFFRDFLYTAYIFRRKEILIILNSDGGFPIETFALFDAIKAIASKRTVHILCMGSAESGATAILQAGTKRLAMPHTQFMLHQTQAPERDRTDITIVKDELKEWERVNKLFLNIIAKRVGMTEKEFRKKTCRKDHWIDAKQALKLGKYGLIDEIVDEIPYP